MRGYHDKEYPYFATFGFKNKRRALLYKIWCPQYSRRKKGLMQSKCNHLEAQGVLGNPKDRGINEINVSL